jgi:uncharacterized membrane protein YjjP (DUF1212 family)
VPGVARSDPADAIPERPSTTATGDAGVELLIRLVRAGHQAGYPAAELEDRVLALGDRMGAAPVEISVTPTVIELTFGSVPHLRSHTLRVRPAQVDLDAIARLDDVVQDLLDGADVQRGLAAVAAIEASPMNRPWPLLLGAYAAAGPALTPILGGGWREAVAAVAAGLVVGAVALTAGRGSRTEPMVAPLAAASASFAAAVVAQLGFDANADVVTLAALVTFLPGMRLTIGMRELATDHLQSGVANTASALIQLLGLVFGVGVGRSIATNWFGAVDAPAPEPAAFGIELLAAVAAGLVFTLTLRARYRDAAVMCCATVLALGANEAGRELVGAEAAVFIAALAVGLTGGLLATRFRRSALVFIVPGVLMLVPGSAGFNSVLQLLTDQTVSGITAGFDTFVTAMSIAYGLIVSASLLPGRIASRRGT